MSMDEATFLANKLWGQICTDCPHDNGDKCDCVDDILAAFAEVRAGMWQPIETAPTKDGTSIIATCGDTVFEAEYHECEQGWWLANTGPGDYIDNQVWPTHWQPMPAPPRHSPAETEQVKAD